MSGILHNLPILMDYLFAQIIFFCPNLTSICFSISGDQTQAYWPYPFKLTSFPFVNSRQLEGLNFGLRTDLFIRQQSYSHFFSTGVVLVGVQLRTNTSFLIRIFLGFSFSEELVKRSGNNPSNTCKLVK